MTTILEALQNAEYNICQRDNKFSYEIGKDQLHNAIALLDKGYNPNDEMETLIGDGSVADVPDKTLMK